MNLSTPTFSKEDYFLFFPHRTHIFTALEKGIPTLYFMGHDSENIKNINSTFRFIRNLISRLHLNDNDTCSYDSMLPPVSSVFHQPLRHLHPPAGSRHPGSHR